MDDTLGSLEHQVLLAMMRIGESAYSVPIVIELEACTGRTVSPSAVYITLRRLEERGLVSSSLERAEREQRGRPRRVFRVEAEGLKLLRESKRAFGNLWSGLEALDDA
jgi:DNA-binding PadR family transcriptional regulator